jgi:Fe-S cluster biogenesis protein NfuA
MDKLNKVLDKIRPTLQRDGGDLKLVNYNEKQGIVEISLTGACAHCPLADVTLKRIVEEAIKKELPEVKEVRAV